MTELIVALDVPNITAAEKVVGALGRRVTTYKVGHQFFLDGAEPAGPSFVSAMVRMGKRVFVDLKLLDIENTVERAIQAIARTGAAMTTVHAYPKVMAAAARAAAGTQLAILGVTVLTSMTDEDLTEAGYALNAEALVALRTHQAREIGIHGLITSPIETQLVRTIVGSSMMVVVPGIRPAGAAAGDQKRLATPAFAVLAGASHIVVGRPIVGEPDPVKAAQTILSEITEAEAGITRP